MNGAAIHYVSHVNTLVEYQIEVTTIWSQFRSAGQAARNADFTTSTGRAHLGQEETARPFCGNFLRGRAQMRRSIAARRSILGSTPRNAREVLKGMTPLHSNFQRPSPRTPNRARRRSRSHRFAFRESFRSLHPVLAEARQFAANRPGTAGAGLARSCQRMCNRRLCSSSIRPVAVAPGRPTQSPPGAIKKKM